MRRVRTAALAVVVGAGIAAHLLPSMGQGYGIALLCAMLQAAAIGPLLWCTWPGRRWLGPLAAATLLTGTALGALHAPETGLIAAAGLLHALIYATLLALFAGSLRPGQTAVVTRIAARLNPDFHASPQSRARITAYTRAATTAWCAVFATQLLLSAALLAWAPRPWWWWLVGIGHAVLLVLAALAEFAVRAWHFRHHRYTGLLHSIRHARDSIVP